MKSVSKIALTILVACAGLASAKAPKAPSNLRVTPLGVNSFLLEWKDNSKTETGWDIRVSLGKTSSAKHYQFAAKPDLTSYVVLTQNLSGRTLSFQVAAYNGATGAEKYSKPTSVVSATALVGATFGNPSSLTSKVIDDGRIRLSWKDNSTTEEGYQVQVKKGTEKWTTLGVINPGVKFSMPLYNLEPATAYSFRVRAFKQQPVIFTKYSNIATATTNAFMAPSDLTAIAEGEGAISLKWKDHSSLEYGFEIESKSGTAQFSKLGEVGPNVVSTNAITGFALSTDYQLRARAFRVVNGARVYSEYSNIASVKTTNLAAPTNFAVQVIDETTVKATWTDASSIEAGYQLFYRKTGDATFDNSATIAANGKEYTITGLVPHQSYDFKVKAYQGYPPYWGGYSADSPILVATTKDGFTGDMNPPIFWNSSYTDTVDVSRPSELTSLTMTGTLPVGLNYNSTDHTISGTTSFEGNNTVTFTAVFKDGWTTSRAFTLRVIRPPAAPVVASAFGAVSVSAGNTSSVSVTGKFTDPDTPAARRLVTTKGNIDIILYSAATPITVANFLTYADGGSYNNTFFHRSVDAFVVQGGGYGYNGTAFTKVTKNAAITNEPGISNVAGTIAMAKNEGLPNSATSEFFFNVNNNAANLDYQNEGFTVFARVAGTGMNLVNAINDLPTKQYAVSIGGTSTTLSDVPMDAVTAPATMDATKLVKINSVTTVPVLSYQATSAASGIATATISGTNVVITGVASGSTTITVTATDLDGQSVTQNIAVTVP